MNLTEKTFGHQEQLKILLDSFNNLKFPHSWIFNGNKGIGKYKTLIEFIKNVTNNDSKFNQNIYNLNSEDKPALINDIRAIINQINLTNNVDDKKTFIIIDNSEHLNSNCFNALLKTIEEPPTNTIIIIITHDIRKIPRTIISRCIKLNFKNLNYDEFKKYLYSQDKQINENLIKEFFIISKGCPGLIKNLRNNQINEIKNITLEILKKRSLDSENLDLLIDFVSKDPSVNLNLLINFLYDFLKEKIIEESFKKNELKNIFEFFKRIELCNSDKMLIDIKKKLHYIFLEYLNIEKINE